jgi:hypothetical protein
MRAASTAVSGICMRRQQRRIATVLSLALCLWFFAYASHTHAEGDFSPAQGIAHHCDICLARPASTAPPPAAISVPDAALFEVSPPSNAAPVFTAHEAPSSYLSRAPPAA